MYSEVKAHKPWRSSLVRELMGFAYSTGLIRMGRRLFSRSLTVLNYHRIGDPTQPNFDSFQPNISANPDMFAQHMEHLARWFKVVAIKDVVQWLNGKKNLPSHAALITFDDGYLDNYTLAYPILKQHGFPAVIFLTSGHIDKDKPFYWDLAAYCFFHTAKDRVMFPDKKERSWKNKDQKKLASHAWVEAMKTLPDTEKQNWVQQLPEYLNVSIPHDYFRNLMVNWGQVREMSKNGIEFGGHTINHPILSRIPLAQARKEIEVSKSHIEQEIGEQVLSFAYPNGMKNDLNPSIETLVAQAGYQAAFTLLNGPTSLREVRQNPFKIRRIFISYTHSLAHFAALTSPINRYRN